MKKTFLVFILLLACRMAHADIILLKNGQVIEGKVTQVRGIFIRVQPDYKSPFREFLIENVAHIEQTNPDEVSHLAVRRIHERAIQHAREQRFQDMVNERAVALIEEAILDSEELTSLKGATDKVKAVAQEKASVIIGEAVKSIQTPQLIDTSTEIKSIAQEKASGVIQQAVKDVEVQPLQNAPEDVQIAVKKAATTLIKGAVNDVETQSKIQREASVKTDPVVTKPRRINGLTWMNPADASSFSKKDGVIAGCLILMLLLLLREKMRKRKGIVEATEDTKLASTLKEIDRELEDMGKGAAQDNLSELKEKWIEKRKSTRTRMELPVSLILEKFRPISATIKDISLGGAFCLCNDVKLLRLGDQCQFKCRFVDMNSGLSIKGTAEVVRIQPNRGLGLKFHELDERSMNYLLKV
ncbi:MAG: PilZ domain-containing protein [Candidatus Omnitrophica bacterium]|nr:PilZ domain-containing protein [Candidatus Omnitrophota bacterium]